MMEVNTTTTNHDFMTKKSILYGSPISHSPPIFELKEISTLSQVKTCSSEPLVKIGPIKRQVVMEITRLLIKAELLLSSQQNEPFTINQIAETCKSFEQKFQSLRDPNNQNIPQYLASNNFVRMFPFVAAHYGCGNRQESVFKKYLDQQLVMNQVLSMASQLARDIHLANHKYIAHQLALLYQSINQGGESMSKFKSAIESKFESIKSVASEDGVPHMKADQKVWLRDLTHDIIMEVLAVNKHFPRETVTTFDRIFNNKHTE